MLKKIGLFGVVLVVIMGISPKILAQEPESPALSREVETELEYMLPVDRDRQIRTISFNILVPSRRKITGKSVVFYKGLTITRSWGSIERWGLIDPDSSAFGIGPVYLVRKQWWQREKWRFIVDFSGGFILYSDNFPAGGENYNFMWRLGPRMIYKIDNKTSWNFGYTLMHISNGEMVYRDPSPNPGYNAGGVTISMNRRF